MEHQCESVKAAFDYVIFERHYARDYRDCWYNFDTHLHARENAELSPVSEALGVIRQFWALEQERRAAREQPSAIRHQIWEQLEVKLDALTEAGHPDLVAPVNSWVRDLLVDNKSFRAPS